jgi:hypothetical protein
LKEEAEEVRVRMEKRSEEEGRSGQSKEAEEVRLRTQMSDSGGRRGQNKEVEEV